MNVYDKIIEEIRNREQEAEYMHVGEDWEVGLIMAENIVEKYRDQLKECDDCVSRKAVVEWLMTASDDSLEEAIDTNLRFLKSVYPAAKTDWIPVSERLPEEGGRYLVTISYDYFGEGPVREVMRNVFCINSKKWLYDNDEVTAWMPLPEAYKAESEG